MRNTIRGFPKRFGTARRDLGDIAGTWRSDAKLEAELEAMRQLPQISRV